MAQSDAIEAKKVGEEATQDKQAEAVMEKVGNLVDADEEEE